jgi:dTDP-4-amino-4,6-dideoxygalactose transaminase
VCSLGDYGCPSFFPSKNLGGAGDGGLVTCTDAAKADRVRMLRNHGMEPKYYHQLVGGNFRLDALQAAVVNAKLPHLDAWTAARAANAARYDRLFAESGLARPAGDAPGASPDAAHPVVLPWADPDRATRHVWNQYIIRAARRDDLRAFLAGRDIGSEIYYPVPLHLQACFADLGYKAGSFPESERAARETLALPVYPELSGDQAAWVVESVTAFFKTA